MCLSMCVCLPVSVCVYLCLCTSAYECVCFVSSLPSTSISLCVERLHLLLAIVEGDRLCLEIKHLHHQPPPLFLFVLHHQPQRPHSSFGVQPAQQHPRQLFHLGLWCAFSFASHLSSLLSSVLITGWLQLVVRHLFSPYHW